MSIMNIMSITLVALILGAMLALYLGVQAASAASFEEPVTAPGTATEIIAAL